MVFIVNMGSNGFKKECIPFFSFRISFLFYLSKKQNLFIYISKLNSIKILIKIYQNYLQDIWCEAHDQTDTNPLTIVVLAFTFLFLCSSSKRNFF